MRHEMIWLKSFTEVAKTRLDLAQKQGPVFLDSLIPLNVVVTDILSGKRGMEVSSVERNLTRKVSKK